MYNLMVTNSWQYSYNTGLNKCTTIGEKNIQDIVRVYMDY